MREIYTNSKNFHNVPIPYEFPNMADLCLNNGYLYDGYVDFMITTNSDNERDMLLLDKLMNAETLVHSRVRSEYPNRKYNLRLSVGCITDYVYYRLYYVIDFIDNDRW